MKTVQQLIRRERTSRLIIFSFILLIFLVVVFAIDDLLISFILAFASAYLLDPVVRKLKRLNFSDSASALIPVLSLLLILTTLGAIFIPLGIEQIWDLKTQFPKYIEGVSLLINKWESQLKNDIPFIYNYNLGEKIGHLGESFLSSSIQYAPKVATLFFTVSLLAPLFTFFIIKDGQKILRSLLEIIPNNLYELSLGLSSRVNQQLGDFVRARIIEAIIVGFAIWVGLTFLNFPYALFLSIFGALMNLIPYVGPFIGAVPALILSIINQDGASTLWMLSLVYLIAQIIDIVFIIPLLVAKTVNLHPLTVVVVFIIGADLMGVLGMIISVPFASVAKLVFTSFYEELIKFKA